MPATSVQTLFVNRKLNGTRSRKRLDLHDFFQRNCEQFLTLSFSTEDSINSIQPFLNKLNDTVHLFSNKSLDTYSQTLKKQFSKYEKESDPAKLSELRKSVIESHNNIISELHKILDE